MEGCNNQNHEKIREKLRNSSDYENKVLYSAKIFSVLGEPRRMKIMLALAEGELCVYHICDLINAKQSITSQHLRKLKDANLVKCRKVANQVLYSLADVHVLNIIKTAIEHSDCK